MSPIIAYPVGPLVRLIPGELDMAPARQQLAKGTAHFTLDESHPRVAVAECSHCHAKEPFDRGTPWRVIDEAMLEHRKYCPALSEPRPIDLLAAGE